MRKLITLLDAIRIKTDAFVNARGEIDVVTPLMSKVSTILSIISVIGLIVVIIGGATFALAFHNDNSPNRSKGIKMIAGGIIAICIRPVLVWIDIIA